MIAVVRIRQLPHYRRQAFESGLSRLGYDLRAVGRPQSRDDLLVLWNRTGQDDADALAWERDGGTVLVCENGYVGGDASGHQLYAISVGQHNGAGWFPVGADDRWSRLEIEVKPWRDGGEYVLVCGQRGIGSKLMASPPGWHVRVADIVRRSAPRPPRLRLHPGNAPPKTSLADDLAGAWACAIWSSASGVKALISGVPVFFDAPRWIAQQAARPFGHWNEPLRDDAARDVALARLAHGQWTVEEIEAGEPFARFRAAGWGSDG